MESTQLQIRVAPSSRPYVYRSAGPDSALSHPLRRSSDLGCNPLPLFPQVSADSLLLEFRLQCQLSLSEAAGSSAGITRIS